MKYFESNPETLLLVNPDERRKRKVKRTKRKVSRAAAPRKTVRRRANPSKPVSRKRTRTAPSEKLKKELQKAKKALASEKKKVTAEKKKVKETQKKLTKAKQEAKKMPRPKGRKNPKRKKTVKRKVGMTSAQAKAIKAAAEKKVERKYRSQLKKAKAAAEKAKKRVKKARKTAAEKAKKRRVRGPSKADQRWAVYAELFGLSVSGAKSRFGTLANARKAASAMKRSAKEAEKLKKRAVREKKTAYRKAQTAKRKAKRAKKVETKAQLVRSVAKYIGTTPSALEGATVADLRKLKKAYQVERGEMLPRGTKVASLPGFPPVPPAMPGMMPAGALHGKAHLAVPHNWRKSIYGKRDAGWWWEPPKGGKYKYVKNPKKKKRKKPSKAMKMLRKVPILGKPAAKMLGKFSSKKKGKRNPEFSIGEVAKITIGAGAGYVGGGVATDFVAGLAETAGLSGRMPMIAGGLTSVLATHYLLKDSKYYVPVMAGVSIAAVKANLGGQLPGEGYEIETGNGFVGGIIDKVKGLVGKGSNGMGYVASDDELLASIDAGMGEYVDIPMEEYIETSPMGEYIETSPMGEYIETSPMGQYDDEFDEFDAEFDDEGDFDDELEEYVETSPLGAEYMTLDPEEEELEEYIETSPMGDSFLNIDPAIDPDLRDDMDDELEGMAEDYAEDIPGVEYGGLAPAEEDDLLEEYIETSPMGAYEELADEDFDDDIDDIYPDDPYADEAVEESMMDDYGYDDDDMGAYEELADEDAALASYEELADETAALAADYEELAGMGYASPRVSRELRRRSRRMRRRRGRRRRPRVLRARRAMLRRRGRRAWLRKLARQRKMRRRGAAVARNFRSAVQSAVTQATMDTPFETGSKQHFRAAYIKFGQRTGKRLGPQARRAFLVAYRASTRGKRAAMTAAKIAGVPSTVAKQVSVAPPVSAAKVARGELSPGQVKREGGAFIRRIRKQPRVRRVRRPGRRRAPRFGGIFAQSIFGRRGRWR